MSRGCQPLYLKISRENWQENKRKTEMKNEILMCLLKQRSFPNILSPLGHLRLEVQHHAALLRSPHNHSPEDTIFDQRDQGCMDTLEDDLSCKVNDSWQG